MGFGPSPYGPPGPLNLKTLLMIVIGTVAGLALFALAVLGLAILASLIGEVIS